MERNEAIAAIRTALKARSGKAWSVTGGRGTAWGWITISVPPSRLGCDRKHEFTAPDYNDCGECGGNRFVNGYADCPAHVCTDRCHRSYITPEECRELGALLGMTDPVHFQGVSIPADNAYRNEYVARAAGLTPAVVGTPYWD